MIIPTGLGGEAVFEDRLNLKPYIVETAVSEIVFEDDNNFNGLFYQDQDWKKISEAFPEMLFVDAVLSRKNEEIFISHDGYFPERKGKP